MNEVHEKIQMIINAISITLSGYIETSQQKTIMMYSETIL